MKKTQDDDVQSNQNDALVSTRKKIDYSKCEIEAVSSRIKTLAYLNTYSLRNHLLGAHCEEPNCVKCPSEKLDSAQHLNNAVSIMLYNQYLRNQNAPKFDRWIAKNNLREFFYNVLHLFTEYPNTVVSYELLDKLRQTMSNQSVNSLRHHIALKNPHKVPPLNRRFKTITVSLKSGDQIEILIFIPVGCDDSSDMPHMFYIPGSGFTLNNQDTVVSISSHLAKTHQCNVATIMHRIAPGNRWPTQFFDCLSAIEQYCKKYQINQFGLAGYSAGAHIAVLIWSFLHHANPKVIIDQLYLFSPMLDFSGEFRRLDYSSLNKYPEHTRLLEKNFGVAEALREAVSCAAKKDKTINDEYAASVLLRTFTDADIANRRCWRYISPLWFPPATFFNSQTAMTIITGVHDYFNLDVIMFIQSIKKAKLSLRVAFLEGEDHSLMWTSMLPIYLSKHLQAQNVGIWLGKSNNVNDFNNNQGENARYYREKQMEPNRFAEGLYESTVVFFKNTQQVDDINQYFIENFSCN